MDGKSKSVSRNQDPGFGTNIMTGVAEPGVAPFYVSRGREVHCVVQSGILGVTSMGMTVKGRGISGVSTTKSGSVHAVSYLL